MVHGALNALRVCSFSTGLSIGSSVFHGDERSPLCSAGSVERKASDLTLSALYHLFIQCLLPGSRSERTPVTRATILEDSIVIAARTARGLSGKCPIYRVLAKLRTKLGRVALVEMCIDLHSRTDCHKFLWKNHTRAFVKISIFSLAVTEAASFRIVFRRINLWYK